MSRSSHHKEKYGKSSGISQDRHHEGTAARTRPLSFDEIMSKRKKKKKLFNDEKGVTEDRTVDRNTVKVTERVNGRNKDSSPGVQKHFPEGDAKASSKRKKENTSMKDDNLANFKDRKIRDSETKLKPKMEKDLKTKGWIEEKINGRRKSTEKLSNITEIEASDKHSGHLTHIDRHVDGRRGKSERENKRRDRNGVDEKSRDRYPARKHDLKKGYGSEILDRKERKESSKSHYEELKLKRRRSRSREGVERNRRSISPLPRSQKRATYRSGEHGELSSYSNKGRYERQHSDIDRSKNTNNGSSSQHKGHGGSISGLGGYSPRKRRTEAAAKTPSPTKRSPEKKSAKWDLALEGSHNTLSVSVPSNFQLPQKTASLNIYEAVSAVAVPSITVKPFSGVSSNSLSTNKNDSVDSVQLTQATRPMRRLYVENIPASASEKAVMECLNNFLMSSGVNHIKGTRPCISCIIHKEKGQALVEFLTPEDASTALTFDGSVFSDSIIKIRRPKDFVELATGEPDKLVAAVDPVSNIVKDSPHKIFIGGISKVLSSKMIMEIASAFGPLKSFHFENSNDINDACAILEYADESVTFRACAGLNGMKLGGQVITVLQVDPNASTLESSVNLPFYGIPDHAKPLLEKPTQVLKLKNLFDPENLPSVSNTEIEEVLEDVRLECVRFGAVKSVNFVKYGSAPSCTLEACEVNEDTEFARSWQKLGTDEMDAIDAKIDTLEVATDYTIAKGDGVEDDKHPHDIVRDESCQPGHFDSDISVENLSVKSILESQDPAQHTSKDSGSADDVIGNIHGRDSSVEDKLPIGIDPNLAEVVGDSREAFVDDHVMESDAIEKGHNELQSCDLGYIFESGCVFVEFARAEASSAAAHCLHGRLFDNRTVTVGYVPLDVSRSRFPK